VGFFIKDSFQFAVFSFQVKRGKRHLEKSRSYRDLEAWRLAIKLVKDIYQVTAKFPPSEIYGLTNQIRRAAAYV
jgi:hypothetical protein